MVKKMKERKKEKEEVKEKINTKKHLAVAGIPQTLSPEPSTVSARP